MKVISSLVIHNIPDASARQKAVEEAVRVCRPDGRVMIADIQHTSALSCSAPRARHEGRDAPVATRRDFGGVLVLIRPCFPHTDRFTVASSAHVVLCRGAYSEQSFCS